MRHQQHVREADPAETPVPTETPQGTGTPANGDAETRAAEAIQVLDNSRNAMVAFTETADQRLKDLERNGTESAETREKLEKLQTKFDRYDEINQAEQLRASAMEKFEERMKEFEAKLRRPGTGESPQERSERWTAFNQFLRYGRENMTPESIAILDKGAPAEERALNVGLTGTGNAATPNNLNGGAYAPEEYVMEILKQVVEQSPIRAISRTRMTSRSQIELPRRTGVFEAKWVGENGTRAETTGYATDLLTLTPYEHYALIDISMHLLQDSVFDIEAEMDMEFAEQFAVAENKAFINGTGVTRPKGFLVDTAASIVKQGESGTRNDHTHSPELAAGRNDGVTYKELLTMCHHPKAIYAERGRFVFNRRTLREIRLLQDTSGGSGTNGGGQYIFQTGFSGQSGVPSTIVGHPYTIAEHMPDIGVSTKSIAFGDFMKGYLVLDRIQMMLLRDPFTQSTGGNIRFLARRRVGGQVVMPEALIVLKHPATNP